MSTITGKKILTIRGELTDLNTYINAERTNKYAGSAIKKDETERVAWYCKAQKVGRLERSNVVIFHWYSKDHRKDFDNIEFAQKFIWDGLVSSGALVDDSQKHTPSIRVHFHDVDAKDPRVEITVSDSLPL